MEESEAPRSPSEGGPRPDGGPGPRARVRHAFRAAYRTPDGRLRRLRVAGAAGVAAVLAAAVLVPLSQSAGTPDPGAASPGNGAVPGGAASAQPANGRRWVGSWQAADERGRPVDLSHRTVRMTMRTTLGGSAVRVRISNTFGDQPLQIGAASVAFQQGTSAVVPETVRPLQFSGRRTVTVPAGGRLYSDPVALAVPARTVLTVSLYLPQYLGMPTSHGTWGSSHRSAYLAEGDQADAPTERPFQNTPAAWYFVDGIDVAATDQKASSVVAFGDSLTDGTGSSLDADSRWTDLLADRLAATAQGRRTAVLNAGIAGNRILSATPRSVPALSRIDRDAFQATGVRTMIVLLGTNDIGNAAASAPKVIGGLQRIAEQAHARGLRVLAGTLTPARGCLCGHGTVLSERQRDQVNRWIRTSKAFDGVVDFERAVRDPRDPARLNPAYDCGDHLHLNDRGYRAMARAVNLADLEAPTSQERAGGRASAQVDAHR